MHFSSPAGIPHLKISRAIIWILSTKLLEIDRLSQKTDNTRVTTCFKNGQDVTVEDNQVARTVAAADKTDIQVHTHTSAKSNQLL